MAGYSGTSLAKKLGFKPNITVYLFQQPQSYLEWLSPLPEGIEFKAKLSSELDLIHLFVKESASFQKEFKRAMKHLRKDGMLWISWPKKSSKVPTDLDENVIRNFGLAEGLVDVKVCAVDEIWSGLKFVFRLKDH